MITKMRFVSITVTDIDKAIDFYTNKLGFKLIRKMPLPDGKNQFVMVSPLEDGTNLVFSLPQPGQNHLPSRSISFETNDVEKTFKELSEKKVEFTHKPAQTPWGGWEAVFVDPFGNSFMLHAGGM